MHNIINIVINNRKVILGVLLLPLIVYSSSAIMLATFNAGTYLGTFLRYIYYYVVC